MKKYLHKLWSWVKSIFLKEEDVEEDIPVEDAFRMWREKQSKKK